MQPEISNKLRNLWTAILPIAISALFFGLLLAFGDYVRQYTATQSYRRRMSQQWVQMDTRAALIRRFEYGAAGGAIIGLLITIRNRANQTGGHDF